MCALTLVAAVATSACDKAPLLAPNGTVIFLTLGSSAVSPTGSVEVIAVLLEQGTTSTGGTTGGTSTTTGGTPVHNGTLVSFTSSIGRIEPADARTENGRVTVRFIGDGTSGAAKIVAYSGGARAEQTLNVGSAAAERVQVTATAVGSSGGTSTVRARVEDTAGNPLTGVPVHFSTTRGTLSATSANTDATGVATVTLTTTVEATVTATAGSKSGTATVTPATRSGLTITAPSTVTASSPAQFTVSVASGASVQSVVIHWGDGQSTPLGAIVGTSTPNHTYGSGGNFVVSASATMADGSTEPAVATSISVAEFAVTLSSTGSGINNPITFTAAVAPNTTQVHHYVWRAFNQAGVQIDSNTTDGNTTQFTFTAPGTYTVRVEVVPVIGGTRTTSIQIAVS